ncbi:hypothetical protein C8Q80DRAFT_1168151 [Daedaleopsis nitida]|nr:hypothetical protein C8Q80DRAFT_1168151 [Daedaleopsis nitida]
MSTYTPSTAVDVPKERDWPAQLGMLDWDSTSIVFTKRSLLEFLKYAGVTVDPNFTNIQKLPRYAQFGKLSGGISAVPSAASTTSVASASSTDSAPSSDFKPSRRVREAPGGAHHDIFGGAADDDDALANAPPKQSAITLNDTGASIQAQTQEDHTMEESSTQTKRRTTSGVAGLWDGPDDSPVFIPTRRVREMPGGKDSISGLF